MIVSVLAEIKEPVGEKHKVTNSRRVPHLYSGKTKSTCVIHFGELFKIDLK